MSVATALQEEENYKHPCLMIVIKKYGRIFGSRYYVQVGVNTFNDKLVIMEYEVSNINDLFTFLINSLADS